MVLCQYLFFFLHDDLLFDGIPSWRVAVGVQRRELVVRNLVAGGVLLGQVKLVVCVWWHGRVVVSADIFGPPSTPCSTTQDGIRRTLERAYETLAKVLIGEGIQQWIHHTVRVA